MELIIEIDTNTLDAPYCDYFTCKEVWILLSKTPHEQKSILLKRQHIKFVKGTIMKPTIHKRALEGQMDTAKKWNDYVILHGHLKRKPINIYKQREA